MRQDKYYWLSGTIVVYFLTVFLCGFAYICTLDFNIWLLLSVSAISTLPQP